MLSDCLTVLQYFKLTFGKQVVFEICAILSNIKEKRLIMINEKLIVIAIKITPLGVNGCWLISDDQPATFWTKPLGLRGSVSGSWSMDSYESGSSSCELPPLHK